MRQRAWGIPGFLFFSWRKGTWQFYVGSIRSKEVKEKVTHFRFSEDSWWNQLFMSEGRKTQGKREIFFIQRHQSIWNTSSVFILFVDGQRRPPRISHGVWKLRPQYWIDTSTQRKSGYQLPSCDSLSINASISPVQFKSNLGHVVHKVLKQTLRQFAMNNIWYVVGGWHL